MIEGPHIFGFSPVALCINLTSTLASARLVSSVSASINAETLTLVGLLLLSAIPLAVRNLNMLIERKQRSNLTNGPRDHSHHRTLTVHRQKSPSTPAAEPLQAGHKYN